MCEMYPHGYNVKSQKARETGYSQGCDCSGLPAFPSINIALISLVCMLSNFFVQRHSQMSLTSLNVSSQGHACLVTQSCLTFVIQGTVARQAPLTMGFSRQEH